MVKVDRTQLETAVLNACVNARDAMPEGGKLIIGTLIEKRSGSPEVVLSISDTGTGMPPHVMQRAFEPFFTTKEVGKGTGLGLSQIHGFAAQAGGLAEISSVEGRGTTIAISLPVTFDEPTRVVHSPATVSVPSGLRVLLAEDNDQVRAFAEDLLTELGCVVMATPNAKEALKVLEQKAVDLLLTDVVMPGMSGIELAHVVRGQHPDLPVVLATGYSDEILREVPNFPVLAKPYGPGTLARALSAALEQTSTAK
jgi:CheY-like chemotaxis protein